MSDKRIVFFKIGGQTYGLDVSYIEEIEKFANLMPVPNTVSHIKGLVNLRGEVIPVYSLRKKFGLPELAASEQTQLIVTKLRSGIYLAFEVDGVDEITDVSDSAETIAPALIMSGDTGYILKVIHLGQGLAILLDPEGILTKEEKQKIEEYLEKLKKEA